MRTNLAATLPTHFINYNEHLMSENRLNGEYIMPRRLPKCVIVQVLGIKKNDLVRYFLTKEVLKQCFGERANEYHKRKVFYNEDVSLVINALKLTKEEIEEINTLLRA